MKKTYIDFFVNHGIDYSHRKMNTKRFELLRDAKKFYHSIETGIKEIVRLESTDFQVVSERIITTNNK